MALAPVSQNENRGRNVSFSRFDERRSGQPITPSPTPVATYNRKQLKEIPAGHQHREVPDEGRDDPDRTPSFPDQAKAEETFSRAGPPRIAEEKEKREEPLRRVEAGFQRGGRVGGVEQDGDDDERREKEQSPREKEKVDPVGGRPDPEALAREDARGETAVRWRVVPLPGAPGRFLSRFRSSPKVELHLHLEGCVAPATLVRLSARWPRPIFPETASVRARRDLRGDFRAFLALYRDVCRCLTGPGDYAAVAADLVRRLRRERIRSAEVYVSPAVVEKLGLAWDPVRDALEAVFDRHERRGGGRIRVLLDSVRQWGPAAAHRVLDLHERRPWPRAVGFGLGGDEAALPARDFADVYARVRSLGLAPLVHAGEWSGPESVADALCWLRPARIAHGIRAADDPALRRLLARRGVVLDVCPSSNVATGALPSLDAVARRVRLLLGAGVPVTISTDDPGLFGTSLLGEYRKLAAAGLTARELARLAAGSRAAALSAPGPVRTG